MLSVDLLDCNLRRSLIGERFIVHLLAIIIIVYISQILL